MGELEDLVRRRAAASQQQFLEVVGAEEALDRFVAALHPAPLGGQARAHRFGPGNIDMDSSQILTITVFVIVITIVGTIALAIVGYLAFRLRDRKHPSGSELDRSADAPHFFERIRIPDSGDEGQDADPRGLPVSDASNPGGSRTEE